MVVSPGVSPVGCKPLRALGSNREGAEGAEGAEADALRRRRRRRHRLWTSRVHRAVGGTNTFKFQQMRAS